MDADIGFNLMIKELEIVEVSARDGIQNEARLTPTADKLKLIECALAAGVRRIEVASFVNPARVPQMADWKELIPQLPKRAGRFSGLALNRKGFLQAAETGLDEVNMVLVATDGFSRRNQGRPLSDVMEDWLAVAEEPRGSQHVSLTIGAAFGCPFEGEVSLPRLIEVIATAIEGRPDELVLADTIGVATPRDIKERVAAVRARWPHQPLRLHLHNTRNTGIANAWTAMEAGVSVLDASLGGTGGCPFAPRATGNISTEDLVYMCDRAGIPTGINLNGCINAARWLEGILGHDLPGMVMKAGGFPASAA